MAEPIQALTQSVQGYVYGDVEIAPGAVMAEGVLLGAQPGCRLVISAGVCLGTDVVIRVSRGNLIVEPGVNLGSGVLVVGHGRIGHHACIGANSTLINPQVESHRVLAPKSLWGDPSQSRHPSASEQPSGLQPSSSDNGGAPVFTVSDINGSGAGAASLGEASEGTQNGHAPTASPPSDHQPEVAGEESLTSTMTSEAAHPDKNGKAPNSDESSSSDEESSEDKTLTNVTHVYGKKQVSQLLETLFPHRHSLNGSATEDKT